MTDVIPTGRDYPELLRSLMSLGIDISDRRVTAQINAHDDGTFTLWCVRIENGNTLYMGRVEHNFPTPKEAGDQARNLPDDIRDFIKARRRPSA